MKLLIFTAKVSERILFQANFISILPTKVVNSGAELADAIKWFHKVDSGVLIVPIYVAATGWNAPDDTIILFSESVKDDAYKLQAATRVHRANY
jgi:hypothetical protein